MTCIVGLVDGKNVWLGGDRAATDGQLNRTLLKDPKIFTKGEIGFGVCGLPKVMDALKHGIDLPEQSDGDDKRFLVAELIPFIREGLVALDAASKDNSPLGGSGEVCFQGAILVAYRGRLYNLQGNFQLVEGDEKFNSVGSGSKLALGSFESTKSIWSPKKRILMALEASTKNAACAPPFDTLVVKR